MPPVEFIPENAFDVSQRNIEEIPVAHYSEAIGVLADDLRTLWSYVKSVAHGDARFSSITAGGSVDTWLAQQREHYRDQHDLGERRILNDLARMVDAAVETAGERNAFQLLQLTRIKRSALQTAPPFAKAVSLLEQLHQRT